MNDIAKSFKFLAFVIPTEVGIYILLHFLDSRPHGNDMFLLLFSMR